jgi:Spy/CpxP family protein refolding chaperone
MRRFLKWTLVLGLALGMVNVAQAQRPGGPGFGPGGMLQNESVQKELKVTDEQKTKLKDAVEKVLEKHRDDFAKLREMSREDRQKLTRTVSEEMHKAVGAILDAKQMKRWKQIQWQVTGPRALNEQEVQKELKLSDEQKKKLATIFEDSDKKLQEAFQGGAGAREKFQEIRKETQEKSDSVLTDEQKKTWKEMKGEPFEFQRPRRQR